MEIVEKFVRGKYFDSDLCEDYIYVDSDFVILVDGVTAKGKIGDDIFNGGRIAVDVILKAIKKINPKLTARQVVDFFCNEIRRKISKKNIYKDIDVSATILIYSQYHKEVWRVGDSMFILNDQFHDKQISIDSYMSFVRAFYNNILIKQGLLYEELLIKDSGREYIMPLLLNMKKFRNSEDKNFGYGAIDCGYVLDRYLEVYKVQLPSEIIFCSDGYPKIFKSLYESEKYLEYILSKDPLCINSFLCTKGKMAGQVSYDDRAYIKFLC